MLTRDWVVTAAHCCTSLGNSSVVVGQYNTKSINFGQIEVQVKNYFIHPKYKADNEQEKGNDICLLQLSQRVEYSADKILPACLPDKNTQPKRGTMCYVAGWGATSFGGNMYDGPLLTTKLPYVSDQKCKDNNDIFDSDTMMCAGYYNEINDACQVR